jgi:hypothetical protein
VETGVQFHENELNLLDSGACPGPDPGFAGMTKKGNFGVFSFQSLSDCYFQYFSTNFFGPNRARVDSSGRVVTTLSLT